ncbi:hypothetical protein CFP56_002443 [Quercus suber]|uniref:Uncharacterized protein n=1 Tax=Quercus suber TaxID=58331 RepID=A0AAW0LFL6_QUESU
MLHGESSLPEPKELGFFIGKKSALSSKNQSSSTNEITVTMVIWFGDQWNLRIDNKGLQNDQFLIKFVVNPPFKEEELQMPKESFTIL